MRHLSTRILHRVWRKVFELQLQSNRMKWDVTLGTTTALRTAMRFCCVGMVCVLAHTAAKKRQAHEIYKIKIVDEQHRDFLFNGRGELRPGFFPRHRRISKEQSLSRSV